MYIPQKKRFGILRRKKRVHGEHFSFSSSDAGSPRMKKVKTFNKEVFWKRTIYTTIFLLLFIASLFLWYSKDLPNPYKINNRNIAQSTKITDRNGELLYEVHGEENRTLVKFSDIPQNIKNATVAIEDKNFYKHSGFNIKGIFRAFLYDIIHRDIKQGGSTITQQYVKNALLTSHQTISRKIKEFILSIEIEKIYSKDEILGMYLNEIPYGNNAYGIQAAAKTYFDKDIKDLTLAESALLAAIPQAPTYYNPYGSNTDVLMGRKNYTLDQMAELKLITKEEAEAAKAEEIKFVQKTEGILAPHFVMYIKELLAEKYGEQKITEGGFVVTTTLDLEKQKMAEEIIKNQWESMRAKGAGNASLVSMDPKTGEVLAMVGSADYFADPLPEGCTPGQNCRFEPNVNVALRQRQPGSSLKPIVYAAAFEKGYAPSTMLMDVETDFGQGYIPKNYDGRFRGPVSIRKSLGNSLNIPAVKTLAIVGVKTATDLAQEMGIKSLNDPDRYGLSMVLGGGEVKLLELVNAYATLANEGVYHKPILILKVQDNNGKVLEEYKPEENQGKRVLDKNIAYLVTNILSDDSARAETFGMGGILTLPGRPVAAKTGTTDDYRDAWTTGYTPSLVTGVWAGNNDNTTMNHAAGSMVAAPIWNEFMKKALAGTSAESFSVPSEIIKMSVDSLTGMLPLENIPEELKEQLPTKEEIFWSKYKPQQQDSVHKIITVLKGDDKKVASSKCPEGMVEQRVFLEFHSIFANNPNWENAVTGWAKANGYNNIPTEEENCQDIEEKYKPSISIDSPKKNDSVGDNLSIIVSFIAPKDVAKVEYFIDEEKIGEKRAGESAGNNFNLEDFVIPKEMKGKVVIKAKLTDKIGLTAIDEKTINIQSAEPVTTPPPTS